MNLRDIFLLLRETFEAWRAEDITRMGAAVAFYAAFSLMPMLIVATAVGGMLFGQEEAENGIISALREVVGAEASQTLREVIENVNGSEAATGSLLTVFGVIGALYGATGVFRHLKNALNTIWEVPPTTPNKVKGFVQDTLVSMLLVMALGTGLMLVLVVNGFLWTYVRSLSNIYSEADYIRLWQALGALMLFAFTTLIFVVIYKVMPDAHIAWGDVTVGALITALLFTIGQVVIGIMFSQSNLDTLYGAASAFMFMLTWVFVSSHIVLFGAEFTQVYANRHGEKITPQSEIEPVAATD